jgi:hypothetical protein
LKGSRVPGVKGSRVRGQLPPALRATSAYAENLTFRAIRQKNLMLSKSA